MSRNRITVEQIRVACRHVRELMAIGVTENLAIRILEHFVDVYAKLLHGGSATPHHVKQVPQVQWSAAALSLMAERPDIRPKDMLRVEHGTPRRALARMVMDIEVADGLTAPALDELLQRVWKLAVITAEEDSALNRLARSRAFDTPDDRWRAAGIVFGSREVEPASVIAAAD